MRPVIGIVMCGSENGRQFVSQPYLDAVTDAGGLPTVLPVTGDTYAYDEEGKKTQKEREERAAERIFGLLPEDQGKRFKRLWQEFEEQKTPEARFARTMDNLQPMMLNHATDGKDWVEHGVFLDQILKRNENTHKGSEALWEYAREHFIRPSLEKGRIKPSRE